MKRAVFTASFRKRLKALRRHFSEADVVKGIERFATSGFGPGECEIKREAFGEVEISVVKLRLRARSATGRYLVAVVRDDYLPPLAPGAGGSKLCARGVSRPVRCLEDNVQLSDANVATAAFSSAMPMSRPLPSRCHPLRGGLFGGGTCGVRKS